MKLNSFKPPHDGTWLISIQISFENNRKLVWDSPRQNLLDHYSHFNWKWNAIGLGQPKTERDWFLLKFQLKMKGNWSGTAEGRIWMISVQTSIENQRKLVWDNPGQNLFDFYLNFNWKWKEIGLGQLRIESDWFLFEF